MYTSTPFSIWAWRCATQAPKRSASRWMPGEHQVDCVDDVVQEIGLICGVAVDAGENHPIGAAGSEYLHRSRPEMGKQTASGATVSRRLAVQHTFVDRPMVAGLDSFIE